MPIIDYIRCHKQRLCLPDICCLPSVFLVLQLVKEGRLTEARIDSSVRRLLRQKFQLGLFDNPFVDETKVGESVGNPAFRSAGEASQRRAMTLLKMLKNEDKILPLPQGKLKIYVRNIDPKLASQYGTVVDRPDQADLAILRLNTPYYPVESPISAPATRLYWLLFSARISLAAICPSSCPLPWRQSGPKKRMCLMTARTPCINLVLA